MVLEQEEEDGWLARRGLKLWIMEEDG